MDHAPGSHAVSVLVPPPQIAGLTSYQFGGVELQSATDAWGTEWWVQTLDGWDASDTTPPTAEKDAAHGAFMGPQFLNARQLTLSGWALAPDKETLRLSMQAFNLLVAGFLDSSLVVGENPPKQVTVRRSGALKTTYSAGRTVCQYQLGLVAADPRKYATAPTVEAVTLPAVAPGLQFPLVFPLTFGSPSSGGNLTVTNEGDFESRPVFQITGPCESPEIQNLTTGQFMSFNITLGPTDVLTVDCNSRAVLLGSASRRATLVPGSQWLSIVPGNNDLTYRAYSSVAASQSSLSVTAYSAWI